ncbi:MAG: 4-hydroxythreonine-4-phosphate dehydrogenase PdxA [Deltaproteobacteria bacterium]|nr:4-hydroxythreonine-4-phosphate dehydrogenase PdxA [Deltaproteobacteria bacterium]
MKPKIAVTLCKESGVGKEILEKSYNTVVFKKADITLFTNIKKPFPGKINFIKENSQKVIEKAIQSCLKKENQALLTFPTTKEDLGGVGHTEILATQTNSKPTMFFTSPHLKVALVTTHIALKNVASQLTQEKIITTIENTHRGLQKYFGIKNPLLYLCGLNPHCGEGGLFGNEEEKTLKPTLSLTQKKGIKIFGPFSPDTIFFKALENKAHAVISLYHDQGLIPLKTLSFFDSCGVTLGLPFLRTTVDHGTAPDLIGKNMANPKSFLYALKVTLEALKNESNF